MLDTAVKEEPADSFAHLRRSTSLVGSRPLSAALGFEVPDLDEEISKINATNFNTMIAGVVQTFPNFEVVATTPAACNV